MNEDQLKQWLSERDYIECDLPFGSARLTLNSFMPLEFRVRYAAAWLAQMQTGSNDRPVTFKTDGISEPTINELRQEAKQLGVRQKPSNDKATLEKKVSKAKKGKKAKGKK
jgi:hypothetical protein